MLIFKTVTDGWKVQVETHILPLACDVWAKAVEI